MSLLRRLDHVAIAVRDTDEALRHFGEHLGLRVAHSEELARPHVLLTYLDAGNAYIQLVEPLDDQSQIAWSVKVDGEGLHHICFGVDDVPAAARALSGNDSGPTPLASGRGRPSAFVVGARHGVLIELTGFSLREDVKRTAGWLA
jgi:methylmalonyl-CoA/ethylmalonyl-CoA epimerase